MVQDRSGALIVAGINYQLRWTGTRFDPLQVPGGWRLAQAQPSARRDATGDAWLIGRDGSLLRARDGVGGRRHDRIPPTRYAAHAAPSFASVQRRIGECDADGTVSFVSVGPMIGRFITARTSWPGSGEAAMSTNLDASNPQHDPKDRAAPGSMLEDRAAEHLAFRAGPTRIQEIPFRTVTRRPGLEGLARQVRTLAPGPHGSMLAEVAR
jgi:hypothetical protein